MTILLTIGFVIVAGLLAYGVLSVFAKRDAPLDTEKEERWFVLHAPGPLRRFLYFADRRVVGGAALAFTLHRSSFVVLCTDSACDNPMASLPQNRPSPFYRRCR